MTESSEDYTHMKLSKKSFHNHSSAIQIGFFLLITEERSAYHYGEYERNWLKILELTSYT